MSETPLMSPESRQVVVNLGNRFVLFGPEGGLPTPQRFDPKDSPVLPRVVDESQAAEDRISQTLQVFGMSRAADQSLRVSESDIELVDAAGNHIFIEVKVKERSLRQRDLDGVDEQLKRARALGQRLEVWFFNIERLKLTVARLEGASLMFDELVPLNVWERSADGVFERQRVVEEVDNWLVRVSSFYSNVRDWLADSKTLHFEQTRTVTMSEEMMQEFAVADREIPVLDVLSASQVVASFVPRGLWLIGAWGRIDIITERTTIVLLAAKKLDRFEWQFRAPNARSQPKSFDKTALLEVIGTQ